MPELSILITGDFYVADRYRGKAIFDASVTDLFAGAGYRVVNLETPLTGRNKRLRILKTGPHLQSEPGTILPLLKALKTDLVTLANNHIMDYGPSGLRDTLAALEEARIETVGAGMSLEEASRPFFLEKNGQRLAFLNFAEHEWGTAGATRPGAGPLDVIDNVKQIQAARRQAEHVIVIIHGGLEHFPLPTPLMVKQYRFYAEQGASAIVGHHGHIACGAEVHQRVPIFYGLGNFLLTIPTDRETCYTGLVLDLRARTGGALSWSLVPVRQSKPDHRLSRLAGPEAAAVLADVEARSRTIADEASLTAAWKALLGERRRSYLNFYSPLNLVPGRFLRDALTKLGLDRLFVRRRHYAQILNTMKCETHAEASKSVIEDFLE